MLHSQRSKLDYRHPSPFPLESRVALGGVESGSRDCRAGDQHDVFVAPALLQVIRLSAQLHKKHLQLEESFELS